MVLRSCIATLLLIAVTVLPARGQDKPKIYFGASSKTLGYGPLWVAVKKGFLEQQGLDGQLVLLRGTPMNVQALAANSLQVGSGGAEAFYEASERGLDLVMIGGIINGLTHDIIAGKKYKSIEDLRGATFGASSLTSGTVTAMKQALKAKGLEYPRDYKILVLAGGSSANLAAL
jgi:ABC-type nitrate/sulfonate/bicarbonate transport system substrate-binding protein